MPRRWLEDKYGWEHTQGLARWDEKEKRAVIIPASERYGYGSTDGKLPEGAAKFEHHQDDVSLLSEVRKTVAPEVTKLLQDGDASWEKLHRLFGKHGLRMERGEAGGYTVLAVDSQIRIKASDGFRRNFSGKANRSATEFPLGAWVEAPEFQALANPRRERLRNPDLRDERKMKRSEDRKALFSEYNVYRNHHRELGKAETAKGRDRRLLLREELRVAKKEIRGRSISWPEKKTLLSKAVAGAVIEACAIKVEISTARAKVMPQDLRSWVADRVEQGDARAAAQLRGWHLSAADETDDPEA
jgi:hypothetical protein